MKNIFSDSAKAITSSNDLYLYVIAGVVAVVVIGGVAGVLTSKKHKKAREKKEDDM